ncbi:vWA domain-containing protein [Pacificoceanicola onchidii]|uniref:vWA domain-containing protein n=1 Tax=Pacificoceanicola onchidii TaxID=2562685 RepID=UPI001F0EC91D|nr:VWA domain-containing protein [Pacificoceanicola onchidii]
MASVIQMFRLAQASACLALLPAAPVQSACTDDAMIVFDGSGSMAEMGFNMIDEPRIFEAQRALRDVMPRVAPHRKIGLIVYGPKLEGAPQACAGVDLRFGPRPDATVPVLEAIDALEPEGNTALTEAVAMAAKVLNFRDKPGTIVLVTDGKETCGGAPCALARQLFAEGEALTVHVIGYKVRSEHFHWPGERSEGEETTVSAAQCLATQTGGEYVSAETVDDLVQAMNRMLGCNVLF